MVNCYINCTCCRPLFLLLGIRLFFSWYRSFDVSSIFFSLCALLFIQLFIDSRVGYWSFQRYLLIIRFKRRRRGKRRQVWSRCWTTHALLLLRWQKNMDRSHKKRTMSLYPECGISTRVAAPDQIPLIIRCGKNKAKISAILYLLSIWKVERAYAITSDPLSASIWSGWW